MDFGFFPFNELFSEKHDQIVRVEQLSDAYHLTLGEDSVMPKRIKYKKFSR